MRPSPEDIVQAIYDAAEKALRVRAGVPEHHNGTATATAGAVTFGGKSRRVILRNAQPGKSLVVSFDGRTSFITVPPDETLDDEAHARLWFFLRISLFAIAAASLGALVLKALGT